MNCKSNAREDHRSESIPFGRIERFSPTLTSGSAFITLVLQHIPRLMPVIAPCAIPYVHEFSCVCAMPITHINPCLSALCKCLSKALQSRTPAEPYQEGHATSRRPYTVNRKPKSIQTVHTSSFGGLSRQHRMTSRVNQLHDELALESVPRLLTRNLFFMKAVV